MASLKQLEHRIEADRIAVQASFMQLRQSVNDKVGSPAGLASGFAAGFAGGWVTMARRQRRKEQAARCPEPKPEKVQVEAKPTLMSRLRSLMVLTMPLWQRLILPSTTEPPSGGTS